MSLQNDFLLETQNDLLMWLRESSIAACCFDFGGTLFDFEPIHVKAFSMALAHLGAPCQDEGIAEIVRGALNRGDDSMLMASAIVRHLNLRLKPMDVAVEKRKIVERLIYGARLEASFSSLLVEVRKVARIAVVTRGMVTSAREILGRSVPELAGEVGFYGRSSFTERLNKRLVLVGVFMDFGWPLAYCAYIADAIDDGSLATELGVPFYRFCPFNANS